MTLRPLLLDPRRHLDCVVALILHGSLIGILAWLDPLSLLFALLLPLFVASMLGAYLFYAQHNFPGMKVRLRADWDYVRAAIESTSLMKLSPLLAWLTADIGIHPVHHLNPRIPHYRLSEAWQSLQEVHSAGRTGLSIREIWGCLRLKVWDSRMERMVTFSGKP